ncbi:hypothetical protein GQR58_029727 [Nymphon striatum]|nr:hypothetical protein GQR58_029727 [Nymphon striatum]
MTRRSLPAGRRSRNEPAGRNDPAQLAGGAGRNESARGVEGGFGGRVRVAGHDVELFELLSGVLEVLKLDHANLGETFAQPAVAGVEQTNQTKLLAVGHNLEKSAGLEGPAFGGAIEQEGDGPLWYPHPSRPRPLAEGSGHAYAPPTQTRIPGVHDLGLVHAVVDLLELNTPKRNVRASRRSSRTSAGLSTAHSVSSPPLAGDDDDSMPPAMDTTGAAAEQKPPMMTVLAKEYSEDNGTKVWGIGVDSDQYNTIGAVDPDLQEYVLTSMLKRVDVAVFEIIKAQSEGNFAAGPNVYDLSVDGVGYATVTSTTLSTTWKPPRQPSSLATWLCRPTQPRSVADQATGTRSA